MIMITVVLQLNNKTNDNDNKTDNNDDDDNDDEDDDEDVLTMMMMMMMMITMMMLMITSVIRHLPRATQATCLRQPGPPGLPCSVGLRWHLKGISDPKRASGSRRRPKRRL